MLKIWLPFNGDLHNQGLDDVTVTNSGATIDNNGKIGKCYSFTTSGSHILIPYETLKQIGGSSTVSFWVNIRSFNTSYATIFSATTGSYSWLGEIFTFQRNSTSSIYTFHISDGTQNHTAANCVTGTLSIGTWYHFALVVDSENFIMKIYQNGSEVGSYNTNIIPGWTKVTDCRIGKSANGYQGDFLMNDFRIYDHALSPKEIKELSKGLVLHYPLNRGGFGGDNLLSAKYTQMSQWTDHGLSSAIVTTNGYKNTYTLIKGIGGWESFYSDVITLPAGTYTFSCQYKTYTDYTSYSGDFGLRLTTSPPTSNDNSTTIAVLGFSTTTSDLTYISTSFTLSTSTNVYIGINGGHISDGLENRMFDINYIKLETGNKRTPWIPNSADTLYSSMGLNNNIEYDVSGYQNNGVQNNTPTYSGNTARYNTSIHFDGVNQTIRLPNLSILLPDSIFTFNIWFKRLESEPSSKAWETILGGPSGFELESCSANNVHDAKIKAYSWGGGNFAFEFDKWNMLTMVQNGTNALFYLNGELKLTGTFKALVSGNYFLGSWRDTTSQNYRGYMSDARIYATALSADDILDLYHTPASIANNGTLMTQGEISEV